MTLDEIKKMTKEEFLEYINSLYGDKKLYHNKLISREEYNKTIGILAGFSILGAAALLYCDYFFVSSIINGIIDEGFTATNITAASIASVINGGVAVYFTHLYKKYKKEDFDPEKFNKTIYSLHDELCKLDEKKLSIIKEKLKFNILKIINEENINKSDVLKTAKIMQEIGLEDLLVRFEYQNKTLELYNKYKEDQKRYNDFEIKENEVKRLVKKPRKTNKGQQ